MPDSLMANYDNRYPVSVPELPDFYNPQPHEVAFFKQQTGIHDDELLKQHIMQVQAKAYKVYLTSLFTDINAHFTQHSADLSLSVYPSLLLHSSHDSYLVRL